MKIIYIFIAIVLVINIISFAVMGYDKRLAILHQRRISEFSLFKYAFFLGATGVFIAMQVFRHKTKHSKFIIGIPICMVFNYICIYYIINYLLSI